jgi:hypothetical protein
MTESSVFKLCLIKCSKNSQGEKRVLWKFTEQVCMHDEYRSITIPATYSQDNFTVTVSNRTFIYLLVFFIDRLAD